MSITTAIAWVLYTYRKNSYKTVTKSIGTGVLKDKKPPQLLERKTENRMN